MKRYLDVASRKLSIPTLVIVILGLTGAFFAGAVPRAHAQGPFPGPCPANPSPPPNSVPCLSIIPQEQTNLTPGSTITLKVNFTNFPSFNAWDIAIKTNQAVLNPKSISVVETFGGTFSPTSNCINGGGPQGCSANDGGGVAHSAGFSLGASDAGNGTLFTITYAVVAGPTTDVTYVNTPAEASSVSAPDGSFVVNCSTTPNQCITGSASVVTPSLVSVVQGTGGALFWSSFTGTWGTWTSLAGSTPFAPALCQSGSGLVELVVTGQDHQIYHKSFSAGAWSTAWDNAGGQSTAAPSCAVLGSTLYAVVTGANSQIYYNTFSLSARTWGSWANIGGYANMQPVIVASSSANRLDVLVVGLDTQLYHMGFPAGTPSGTWDSAPNGRLANIPAAASDASGINVVVQGFPTSTGASPGPVWYDRYAFSSASWSGFQFLSGYASTTPAIAIDSTGALQVAVTGLNGNVYTISKPSGGAFGSWTNLGGTTSSQPTIVTTGANRAILVRGSTNIVESDVFSGTTWAGFADTSAVGAGDPVASALQ